MLDIKNLKEAFTHRLHQFDAKAIEAWLKKHREEIALEKFKMLTSGETVALDSAVITTHPVQDVAAENINKDNHRDLALVA